MCSITQKNRPAFTLIELLVVIAIIGVLVGMLLPAIQKTRQAVKKVECQNNLKQIGIALHAYHDGNGKFPKGCSIDDAPEPGSNPPNYLPWGNSWFVYTMPYYEQAEIYQKWQYTGYSGWINVNNITLLNGLLVKTLRCPSSPCPVYENYQGASFGAPEGVFLSDYAGVSGACGKFGNYTENRCSQGAYSAGAAGEAAAQQDELLSGANSTGGLVSAGGILFPHSAVKLTMVKDGTSNTMMVTEHSDWIWNNNGQQRDWRPGGIWGFAMGCSTPKTQPPSWNNGGDNREFNCTTVRYSINDKYNKVDDMEATGIGIDNGSNSPIRSTHLGGANVLFVDGSVHFLTNSTPLPILQMLATRDDGQAFELPF